MHSNPLAFNTPRLLYDKRDPRNDIRNSTSMRITLSFDFAIYGPIRNDGD